MDDLGAIFSLNNSPGHLSYALIAVSYWLTDMFWLRAMAVIGLSLEILYFWLSGGDLRAGIGWDLIFIAINLYQIYRLMKDRLSLRLPEFDRKLLRSVLSGSTIRRSRACSSPASFAILPMARRSPKRIAARENFLHLLGSRQSDDRRPRGLVPGAGQLRRRGSFPDGKAGHGDGRCQGRRAGARL